MTIVNLNKFFEVEIDIFDFIFGEQLVQRDEKRRLYITITVSTARVKAYRGRCVGVGAALVQYRVYQGKQWIGFNALGLQ